MDHAAGASTTPRFTPRLTDVAAGPIVAGGRLLDAVAAGELYGTLEDIAGQIDVDADDLAMALAQLTEVGWVTLEPGENGSIRVRLGDDAR